MCVSSSGSGNEHVIDTVWQCQQYVKEQEGQERSAPCRLLSRKEIFTPWHCATDLILPTNGQERRVGTTAL